MKIIVDAFGGDNAPHEIILGSAQAIKEFDVSVILVGNESIIKEVIEKENVSMDGFEIVNAEDVISMDDEPTAIMKAKNKSSMAVALKLLKDGMGDALVSAGSTGALLTGATLIVKRIKGVKRPALAPVLPGKNGCYMLIDSGANAECKPEYLQQFGIMGSVYMNKIMDVKNPKVALANNGTEEHKGTPLFVDAHKLLKEAPINFIGNIEGRDIVLASADVVVCDGFTGNLILKTVEGMGFWIKCMFKDIFKKNLISKLAGLCVMGNLKTIKSSLDYKEYGGAALMGVSKPVIKAHGSSDARAIRSAIYQAICFTNASVISIIEKELAQIEKTQEEK